MIKHLFLCLLTFLPFCLFGKTLVFTTGFNRPDFVELQYRLFDKLLEDDYEYIIISDANTPERQEAMNRKCLELGITCIQVPQEIHDIPYLPRGPGEKNHNPNSRHCNAVQWSWDNYFSKHEGPVMLIDSDMFPIRPFSVKKMLGDNHFAGIHWGTNDIDTGKPYSYLWLALILFNNEILPERNTICFNCGKLPNTNAICDSGGWTHFYLARFKDILKLRELSYVQGHTFYCPYRYGPPNQNFENIPVEHIITDLKRRGFNDNEISLVLRKPNTIELLGDNTFLHYRAGSNYENYSASELESKDKVLMEFFEKILSE